jgi:hypothetical protein
VRLFLLTVLSVVFLVGIAGKLRESGTAVLRLGAKQTSFSSQAAAFSSPGQAIRTPDSAGGQPGAWPQQATKKTVDVTELKTKANELVTMSQALSALIAPKLSETIENATGSHGGLLRPPDSTARYHGPYRLVRRL